MRPMTVLVVEDVEDVRVFTVEVLSHRRYHVLTASSLAEAEAVREQVGLAALGVVITNLRLTRNFLAHEGIDLILQWHALDPDLPFILISSDLRSEEIVHLPVKVVGYLSKPFTSETLLDRVQEALQS